MITTAGIGPFVRRVRVVQALVLTGLIGVGEARATEPDEQELVKLAYTAGPECPGEASFRAEVKARVSKPVIFTDSASARAVTIHMQFAGERARGDLDIVETTGERTSRSINADTCAEVASGLALVVALALDPNARTEPLDQTATPPPPPRPAPAGAASAPPPKVAPRPPVRERPLRFFGGLAGSIGSGYAPVANIVAGALLGARLETRNLFSPSLYLTPSWGKTGVTGPRVDEAEFSWFLVRIDGCPARLRAGTSLAFWGCVSSELGNVNAVATVANPDEQDRLWVDLGPSLRARLSVGWFFLDAGGAVLFPLTQHRFFVAPDSSDSTVHQIELAVFGGTLALGGEI